MINKDSKQKLDEVVAQAALQQTESQKQAQALAPGVAQQQGRDSFFNVFHFNEYLKDGRKMKPPKEFIPHILVEQETTILFSGPGVGKTVLAIQIAIELAEQGKRVLYVNFELSQLQLALRYPNKDSPDALYHASIDYTKMHDVTDQSMILSEIERMALELNIEVIIIDNFTNLCINSKEAAEAGKIMQQLVAMRMTHNCTMLILAHVPKRKPGDPLTIDDLAGSKLLSNLADNIIGFNKSRKDKDMRYFIQLKYRSLPIELDFKNVQELTLTSSDGWLHFEYGGYDEERAHLPRSRDERAELERDIIRELKQPNGSSYRDIADKLGTSSSMVQRVAKSNGLNRKGK
ncbi:AAA family ATPase [Segatella copri]|uniref:AAA family ATPase n=1 Tax=Segatella copri TaxID=165179 RepID=UPI001C44934D|nr:AAA family ATPase [Segatella copri]MBW0046047.1 AAA family ATPase [Segatella copri]